MPSFIYSMLLIYSLYSTSIYISHLLALLIFTLSTTLYLLYNTNLSYHSSYYPFHLFISLLFPIPYSPITTSSFIPLFPILHYSTHLHYFTLSTIHYILFFITILSLTITKHITTLSFTLFPISYTHIPITLLVHYPLQPSHYYILTHITYLTFIILYSTLLPTRLPFPLSSTLSHFTLLYFLLFIYHPLLLPQHLLSSLFNIQHYYNHPNIYSIPFILLHYSTYLNYHLLYSPSH